MFSPPLGDQAKRLINFCLSLFGHFFVEERWILYKFITVVPRSRGLSKKIYMHKNTQNTYVWTVIKVGDL